MKTMLTSIITMFAFLASTLSSCTTETSVTQPKEGYYSGTFIRSTPGSTTSKVTLMLKDSTFEGNSDSVHYPAICNGSYAVKGDEIVFSNACMWTADFDWSLILSGTYKIQVSGNRLQLTKELENGVVDRYELILER